MADRYWVGGTGTWDASDTTHWSATSGGSGGASVPTSSDDVYFNSASNATGYTVTTATGIQCRDLNIAGPASDNVTWANTNFGIDIYGNLITAGTGITWNLASGTFTFRATTPGKTVTTNGLTLANSLIFDGVGGSWVLQDSYTTGATRACTLTNGTLDLNGKTLTVGLLNSNNSNTRTLAFGATGQIYLTGNNATVVNMSSVTGLTVTGTPVVNCTYSGATGTRTLTLGSLSETDSISFNITAGTDIVSLTGSAKNLNFTGFAGTLGNQVRTIYGSLTVSTGMTLSAGTAALTLAGTNGTKTVTLNGKTLDFPVIISGLGSAWEFADALTLGATRTLTIGDGTLKFKNGTTQSAGTVAINGTCSLLSMLPGSTWTISQTSGTVNAANASIQDSIATGGATWNAYGINGNSNLGNNTGWDFTSADMIAAARMLTGVGK